MCDLNQPKLSLVFCPYSDKIAFVTDCYARWCDCPNWTVGLVCVNADINIALNKVYYYWTGLHMYPNLFSLCFLP